MILPQLPSWLRLLRPHQYTKNLLVFSAPGAAGRLDEASVVAEAATAFALFCAISSAGYVLNDLLDADADRLHPLKRHRPIASGAVTPRRGATIMLVLAAASIGLAFMLGWQFAVVLALYGIVSVSYSTALKRIAWIELVAVSGGFLLRAVGGGAATDTPLSGWFLLVVSAGALLLITGKRLGELITLGQDTPSRVVLSRYNTKTLRQVAGLAAVLAVGGYAVWAAAEASDRAASTGRSSFLRLTAIPFAVAIWRYLMLSWRGAGETPESLVVRDRIVVAAGVGWAALYAIGLYA